MTKRMRYAHHLARTPHRQRAMWRLKIYLTRLTGAYSAARWNCERKADDTTDPQARQHYLDLLEQCELRHRWIDRANDRIKPEQYDDTYTYPQKAHA